MNNISVYIPTKDTKFTCISGCGYTNKGKGAVSYKLINSQRIPVWIDQLGGYLSAIALFQTLIDNNYDAAPMAQFLNISPTTCKTFLKKHMSSEYIQKELFIRQRNISLRRSLGIGGVSKSTRGKSYYEIYGTKTPTCGFKKGDQNPNFSRSRYTGCTLKNKSGKLFRSSYEVVFSDLLEQHNIKYEYEHQYKLCNGKVKIVDFIIVNKLVEITGYAYKAWRLDFDAKIALLYKSYPLLSIVIVSTSDNIQELTEKHNYATVIDINDHDRIVDVFKN